jgi:poly(3-hydroxybutyrate) depolymerase
MLESIGWHLPATLSGQFPSSAIFERIYFLVENAMKLELLAAIAIRSRFKPLFKTLAMSLTALLIGILLVVPASAAPKAAAKAKGVYIDSTMVWDGVTRYYEVYLPANLSANPAMVLMLHGTSKVVPPANPSTANWGWQNVANKYGFLLVKPASTLNATSGQWNWNAYDMSEAFTAAEVGTCTVPPATACPDDAGFLRQLIVNLTAQYNVNPNQVYVAGFSSGAQMAHRVGVEISDLVAAVVIGSGTIVGQPTPPPINMPGPEVAPVSIQEWHGTEDTEIPPCNNGVTKYSNDKFYLATVDQSFNYWTAQNQCTTFQNNVPLCQNGLANQGTTGNDATGCTNNTEVQFIWEQGVGHNWETQNDTTKWLFFASHPKQPQ